MKRVGAWVGGWVLSLVASCSSSPAPAPSDPLIATGLDVKTSSGALHGALTDNGARAWKGIPYAAPPTGSNRFRAPQPAPAWSATRDATTFGSKCFPNPKGAEDCLFLNVWAPASAPRQVLPVMVFFHGGAFLLGSGSDNLYEGSLLANKQGLVVVTVNYRLGALGFLGHSALSQEDPKAGTGNYGLLDQRAALAWVQQNIHAFGGDASNITIFGESAGGWSVSNHLISPGSKGLFQRAIIESGATGSMREPTVAEAEQQAEALAKALGCSGATIPCLRAAPFEDLGKLMNPNAMSAGGLFEGVIGAAVWFPVSDGVFIPGQPFEAWAAGPASVVPTIVGTNSAEGAVFHAGLLGDRPLTDEMAYEAALTRMFSMDAPKVLARYPASSFKNFDDAIAHVETDAYFTCPARRSARALAKANAPTFRYQLQHGCDNGTAGVLGPTHAAELPYVFGNNDVLCGIGDSSEPLRSEVMAYWARFAKAGDPNGGASAKWTRYDGASDPYMAMNVPAPSAATGVSSEACDFWDSLAPVGLVKTY